MLRKFARFKEDGYVMAYSEHMDAPKFDFFEYDGAPPEFIQDLPKFLAGKVDDGVVAKPRAKRAEPQFLKTADGTALA